MMNFRTYIKIVVLLLSINSYSQTNTFSKTITSPDKKLNFKLVISADGNLQYQITRDSLPIIQPSDIDIVVNEQHIGKNVFISNPEVFNENQKFGVYGSYREVNSQAIYAKFPVVSDSLNYELHVKVFDKGIGFRQVIPNTAKDSLTVSAEAVQFNFKDNPTVYSAENYESIWQTQKLDTVSKTQLHTFPVLAETKNHYVLLAEAMHLNYGAITLKANNQNGFTTHFTDRNYYSKTYTHTEDIVTPWRVIMINDNLNDLVNNSIVYELADKTPDEFSDTSWIKRGASAWSWISGGFQAQVYDKVKEMIDGASAMGWPYATIDDGWEHWENKWEQVKKLCDYAKTKDVKIILWKPTGDYKAAWQQKKFGNLKMIKGLLDPNYRNEFFKKAKEAGVAGLKIDFVDEGNLERINIYKTLLEETFEHQLVVNFHGSNMPSGLDRTYPNEVTREAVRGMENVWNKKLTNLYKYNTILPFSRYVIGPGDYTPILGFYADNAGSRAHQFANVFITNSPFSAMGIDPNKLKEMPEADIMMSVPTFWDETKVLNSSKIGEVAAIAKRFDKVWYLAVVNADKSQRIEIKYNEFLPSGKYKALIYKDKGEIEAFEIDKMTKEITSDEAIELNLKAGQGYLARFIKL